MGSVSAQQGAAPQHELPAPERTRLAASPYFSRTTSLIFSVDMGCLLGRVSRFEYQRRSAFIRGENLLLLPLLETRNSKPETVLLAAHHPLPLHSFVARAALVVEKSQQLFQHRRVGGLTQKPARALHLDQVFVLQFLQMMREDRIGNLQLFADLADHHAL